MAVRLSANLNPSKEKFPHLLPRIHKTMSITKSVFALAVLFLAIAISKAANLCQTDNCSPGPCPNLMQANCDGTFYSSNTYCGCCGYCVENIAKGGGCVPITDGIPRATCAAGTSCKNFICQ